MNCTLYSITGGAGGKGGLGVKCHDSRSKIEKMFAGRDCKKVGTLPATDGDRGNNGSSGSSKMRNKGLLKAHFHPNDLAPVVIAFKRFLHTCYCDLIGCQNFPASVKFVA